MEKFLVLVLVAAAGVRADGVEFTSAGDGDWNNPKTWVQAGIPSPKGGDVVLISAGHEVTIPAGCAAKASGSVAKGANDDHGILTINGSLTLDGKFALNDRTELRMGPGGSLDLAGHRVVLGAGGADHIWLRLRGTSKRRVKVNSSKPGGLFTAGPRSYVGVDFDYADFSGLGDCLFGRRADETQHCRVRHSTFVGCGDLSFSFSGMKEANDFVFEHCDFRRPTGKRKYLLLLGGGGDAPTGKRTVSHCTFDGEGQPALLRTMVTNLTIQSCVFEDAKWGSFHKSGQKVRNSFFHTSVHNCLVLISCAWGGDADVSDCYLFADGGNPHSVHMGVGKTISGCVFEADDPECNHVIASRAVTIERCIVLGTGTLFSCVTVNPGPVIIRNNTIHATRASAAEPMLILTEGRGHTLANCTARNNLLVDSDTTDRGEYAIGLVEEEAGQVKADYNNFYGYPGGDVRVHYHVWWRRPAGKPVLAVEAGGHDMNIDPKFVDRKRNLASWDKSIGGPGTRKHAIEELLKLNDFTGTHNKKCTAEALVRYIREGLTPQSPRLAGTGDPQDGSTDIGAVPVGKPRK